MYFHYSVIMSDRVEFNNGGGRDMVFVFYLSEILIRD
jgi:hypothetical protein